MKCEKCGKEIEENSKFCSNCGEKIEDKIIEVEKVNTEENNEQDKQENQSKVKNAEIINEEKSGLSVASLILGIAAILCVFEHGILNITCGILAIVFGAIGRKKGAKGTGTAGMILGIASIVLFAIVLIYAIFFATALIFGIALS